MATHPIPDSVFVLPEHSDWSTPDGYPKVGDLTGQPWAWEFLRRNARYAASFDALQKMQESAKDWFDRKEAEDALDRFCLMWQISKPVDPATKWDVCEKTWLKLIGPPPLKVELPILSNLQAIGDSEIAPSSDVHIPALQTQVLIRVSVGGDAVEQGRQVTQLLQELQEQKTVETLSGQKISASLNDHNADSRYVRIAPGLIGKRNAEGIDEITELAYGRTHSRVSPSRLHFILRTLDAITLEQHVTRSDINPADDEIFFYEPHTNKKGTDEAATRKWAFDHPFGERADAWVKPLSKQVAAMFRKELKYGTVDTRSITQGRVREWMRMARRYVLEQGYVQLAMSDLLAEEAE
jgi:hypothetical protein